MVASEANPSGRCRKHLCLSENAEYQVAGERGMWLLGTRAEKGVEHGLGVLSLCSSASSCQPSSGYQGKWASVLICLCYLSLERSFKPLLRSPLYPFASEFTVEALQTVSWALSFICFRGFVVSFMV